MSLVYDICDMTQVREEDFLTECYNWKSFANYLLLQKYWGNVI